MNNPIDIANLDAIAEAVAARLAGGLPSGPGGEPGLKTPPGWQRPEQLDDGLGGLAAGARVGLAGVEFTQSTQYNGITGPGYGSDNAVSLVAYKTLVARTYPYVRRAVLGGDTLTGQRVTGELTLSIGDRVVYRTGPTRADGARLGAVTDLDRSLWDREFTAFGGGRLDFTAKPISVNSPLNFLVPAYFVKPGRIYATVRLWPVADGPMSARSASSGQYLQFLNVQAPKVCLVRVDWKDAAGNVTTPTDQQMLDTLRTATRMLPFPYFETTILSTDISSSLPFATLAQNGGCNPSWTSLVADLNVTRIFTALFQLGDIVYAMVPAAAIPAGATQINAGCGIGAGGGFIGYETVFAHELGHLYGRAHVAVPGDPDNDTGYPNYGGSKRSIGEVGIDTGAAPPTLYDPSNTVDLMAYTQSGDNQWISPYTYQAILDARDRHQSAAVDPRRLRPLRSVLVLDFRLYREVNGTNRVEIRKAARIDAPGDAPPRPLNAVSPLSLDLLDANQRILATHHCYWTPPHGSACGCGCDGRSANGPVALEREPWLDFQEVVEWPAEDVAAVSFHRGGEPFHTISVGEAPSVSITGPERHDGELVAQVVTAYTGDSVSVVVLFSPDDGATWQPVAYDPPDGQVVLQIDQLPGGERCRLRAIATAALRSATADTDPFDLPRRPRRLYIGAPADQCATEGPVALTATVDAGGLGPIAPGDIRWTSDLEGELGYGYALAPELREGRHELTVTAPDGLGGLLTERGIIIVGGRTG